MLTNCPLGKKEIPDCWKCEQFDRANNYICKITGEKKGNPAFAEGKLTCSNRIFKVKPRKVQRITFCEHCGKKVAFYLDWIDCAWPTEKGVITYRELEAHCPHCYREIYVPAVNDINVYSREKAYKNLLEMKCPACNNALEHIDDLDSHAGDFNGSTTSNLYYECPNCKGLVNIINEEENGEKMFIRIVYRKYGYKEKIKIIQ